MLDISCPIAPVAPSFPRLQRACGAALVVLRAGAGPGGGGQGARLVDLAQSGSAKAMLPRSHSDRPEVVFLNTSGGLTGGDSLRYALRLGDGARATAATQTAERAYSSTSGQATLDVALDLGAGAALDWLPQETILFDGAALHRATRVQMADDARCVLAEMVVLGRAAMGETLGRVTLRDRREIRRGGRLCLVDPLHLDDAALDGGQAGARRALWNGARATATLVLVAPGAEDAAAPLRAVLAAQPGVEAAASGWDGRTVVRMLAPDALPLKRAVAAALDVMRNGRALPRVWQI